MRLLLLLLPLLAGCASTGKHIPETIMLRGGATTKHELDEPPTKIRTLQVDVTWRLK